MSDALGWAGIVALVVGVDWACKRVFGASTRDLGQRWAARIDAWFQQHDGGDGE